MILEVIVDISTNDIDRTFDYEGDDVPIGSRVVVEFGKSVLSALLSARKRSPISQISKEQRISTHP